MIAINDCLLMESLIYKLLKYYFKEKVYYVDLLDLFHESTCKTELGQLMDLITASENHVNIETFTIER
jgi:farnesyl diphosphate synthase